MVGSQFSRRSDPEFQMRNDDLGKHALTVAPQQSEDK